MDGSRALLIDLVKFLESVEARIMNRSVDLTDLLQITNIKHCFNTMDSMLKQCEKSVSTQDLNEIKDRINSAKETVELLESSANLKETGSIYGDLYLIDDKPSKDEDYRSYGRHLKMTNEEFDKLIEDWAEDIDTSQKNTKKREINKTESFQEQIKGEMAQLADTMKSKAMRYRDIIVKDNKALLKFTGEQEKQLDTVTHVAMESSKLVKSTNLSLMQLIIMAASMIGLTMLMMFIFIIT
ncbi:hypothetical protein MACJ_000091 [Theileria orientalis]|uniref:Uncharacterized protein n=1 Tax=Theileria orientalis TaxID=68886 RepID=A0A976M3H7_THEOR|nr:hypothetical protein MACJ_000091 [Theileria orientalis]